MSVTSLAKELVQRPAFKSRFRNLLVDSVALQFATLERNREWHGLTHDWTYLLKCASVLALCDDDRCEDASLRIAQHCLVSEEAEEFRDAACVILSTLTNRPSIQLAEQRKLVSGDIVSRLPFPLKAAWLRREISYMVITTDGRELLLNKFQKRMWDAGLSTDVLSVSAPTSAGKSFLLYNWLMEHVRNHSSSFIVYVVPTRALIYQVENDLRQLFTEFGLPSVNVSSLPMAGSLDGRQQNVMVLTQERLHILLNELSTDLSPDLLIVDEAHKLGDGARGILLQNVIDSLSRRSQSMRLVFASPMVSNPEIMLRGRRPTARRRALISSHVTVNQNLLWVSQVTGCPQDWIVELCVSDDIVPLGCIKLPFRPNPVSKRLTFIAKTLADPTGGNLVYVNGAADAEKAAHQLWDLSHEAQNTGDADDLAELIDLVKRYIHPKYALATTLQRGVAFHYGNMPLLIRTEIERLFKENRVRFLVCTSTLIEGVNLPCKSIFVRGPQKGRGKPMNETDFWNLAGRAGRLGKEFQGNIVCVDPRRADVWKTTPPTSRTSYVIAPAADVVFRDFDKFISYLSSEAPIEASTDHPDYDQLLSCLLAEYSDSNRLADAEICAGLAEPQREELGIVVESIKKSLSIPMELITRNAGINPVSMQRLLQYFKNREGPVEELLPVLPESQDAVDTYGRIFQRINSHVSRVFGTGNRVFALAILVVGWMNGHPLSRLISSRAQSRLKRNADLDLAKLIREVMQDVEQVARFTAPKFLACYVDILRHHLVNINRADLTANMPNVNLWLEFGASQMTQLSMMGLGLSRTTAIALSEFIVDDKLSEREVLEKIRSLQLESLGLPKAVIREVRTLLGSRGTTSGGDPAR